MNTFNKIFKLSVLALICGASALACKPEVQDTVAKAVLGDVALMNFAASNPAEQIVTVYSDGDWHTTRPDWITVTPETGSGVTTVTVQAAENTDAGGMLEPRKDTLIFSGRTLASRLIIIVSQEGDAYRNAAHLSLDNVSELADGKAFILDEATVTAVTTSGFVVSDGTATLYAKSSSEVGVGDKISMKGLKGSLNGLPSIAQADEVTVKQYGTYTYPEAIKFNEAVAGYKAETLDFVTVSGTVAGGNLVFSADGADYSIKQIDCPSGLSISTLGGHKVTLKGYICGVLGANMFGIITTERKDNGIDQLVFFEDDFEWLEPWTTAAKAGDAIATNNPSTTAPNVFTSAACEGFVTEFMARGYGYFEGKQGQDWTEVTPDNAPPAKVLYLQTNYLKFGKSDWNSGLTLPAMSAIEGSSDATLEFDWCWQVTGAFKPDLMTITVEIVGNGTCEESGSAISVPIESAQSQVDGESKIEWQHATVKLKGIDSASRIKIRPTNNDPYIENPARGQNRWYLDNIKVLPAGGSGSGGGAGGSLVFEDDYEWMEPWTSVAGAGDDVKANSVNTDTAPNVFANADKFAEFIAEFQKRGYGYVWGWAGQEWSAGDPDSGDKRTLYLQRNYLKFGKTGKSSGIILPALEKLSSAKDVVLTFDWCYCMTGTNKPDLTTLTLTLTGGGTFEATASTTSEEIVSAQVVGEDGNTSLAWQPVSITIKGATAATRITIRPTNNDPKVTNSSRNQNRWYLDNVKIVAK